MRMHLYLHTYTYTYIHISISLSLCTLFPQPGVAVCYQKVKIMAKQGLIINDLPYISFPVQAVFLVYSPKINEYYEGTVNKVDADHVSILMHGVWSCSIRRNGLSPNFTYDADEEILKHNSEDEYKHIKQGTRVRFQVTELLVSQDYFSLNGSIKDETQTGNVEGMASISLDSSSTSSSSPSSTSIETPTEQDNNNDEEVDSDDNNDNTTTDTQTIQKEENENDEEGAEEEAEEPKKKKKLSKKRKAARFVCDSEGEKTKKKKKKSKKA